jgi:large subunit ribosomal protein L6
MSRIGRMPITVPAGVTVTVSAENVVTVKGPKGELTQAVNPKITVKLEGATLLVERHSEDKEDRSLHGLYRALINNMIVGVTEGYQKKLEIVGVGYRVALQGKNLNLGLGYSHPIIVEPVDGITFEAPDATTIIVKGIDKQLVGETAAVIRGKRPPEPYHGKGVKYADERIRRKAGKTGK